MGGGVKALALEGGWNAYLCLGTRSLTTFQRKWTGIVNVCHGNLCRSDSRSYGWDLFYGKSCVGPRTVVCAVTMGRLDWRGGRCRFCRRWLGFGAPSYVQGSKYQNLYRKSCRWTPCKVEFIRFFNRWGSSRPERYPILFPYSTTSVGE